MNRKRTMVKPDGSPDEDSSPGSSQVAPAAKGYAHLLKVRENFFSLSVSPSHFAECRLG